MSRKLDDSEVARLTGSSVGKAKSVVATGKVMATSEELSSALEHGDISLDQAAEIASAEASAPGSVRELVAVAQEQSFHVLKEKARKKKLEAEQHRDLAARQRAARLARSHSDELGMVHIHLELEPHVGAPIVARIALELGEGPEFDGVLCTDCGNRFRTEFDHVQPRFAGGPMSSVNLKPRCRQCHEEKTRRDRRAGQSHGPDP